MSTKPPTTARAPELLWWTTDAGQWLSAEFKLIKDCHTVDFTRVFDSIDAVLRGHVNMPLNEGEVGIAAIKIPCHGLRGKLESVSKILDRAS